MKKIRSFFTVLFLLTSLMVILFMAIFDHMLLIRVTGEIKNFILPSVVALVLFLVLVSGGIVSNAAKPLGSLMGNGLFQLAVLELFLLSAGLVYYRQYIRQPGNIIIRLQPEKTREFIKLGLKFKTTYSSATDTVIAPGELKNLYCGKYSFETLDPEVVYFHSDVTLEPAETETLIVPVVLDFKTLAVNTKPEGAEIFIYGVYASKTPDTLEIFSKDSVILELKMEGYQSYIDTITLTDNIDLGTITLLKLFTLRVSCYFEGIEYMIYNADNRVVFTANGSRTIQLPQGKYKLSFEIGEGQYETRRFSLNYNYTIYLP
jgi:hypothetical protein